MKNKVAITTGSFAEHDTIPVNLLVEKGFEVISNTFGRRLNKKETLEMCSGCVGIIAGTEIYDMEILEKLKGVKVISRCGTGMDSVDINAANKLGIKVFNTPDAPTLAVAELTVGLILNLLRKINQMDSAIRSSRWEKLMGNLLNEKKVGIIGFGKIGQKVAMLLHPFNCEIRYCDIRTDDRELITKKVELEELLKISDIISIHVSSNEQIIGEREIKMMKKGGWLINVSRGMTVDENALYQALKSGYLSGAAMDVFEKEPYSGMLTELDNVILTPHIGSYAKESRVKMEIEAVENLLKGLGNS